MSINKLVDAFLAWPLPASVCSDLCATKQGAPHRSGTTLLSADEAKQMIEYLLATHLAALTLRWSTEKPTQEGLYWWTNRQYPPIVVQVVQYGTELGFYRICDPVWHVELDGEWAGPLPVPLEAPQ